MALPAFTVATLASRRRSGFSRDAFKAKVIADKSAPTEAQSHPQRITWTKPKECPMSRPVSSRKPRASSQLRIAAILAAARSLLAEQGVGSLSIYSVAERAQMPPSSVYHFFASVPALLEALTAQIHGAFRACLQAPIDATSLRDWRDLSRLVEERMLAIYSADAAARQLILTQHGLTEINQADRQHDIELGRLMHALFDRYFQLPALPEPEEIDVFALAMELG